MRAVLHRAVDTLGHLLALHVTAADIDDRKAVAVLAGAAQAVTDGTVEKAFVDQGYTGERAAAQHRGIEREVVRLPRAERVFVLLQRRWVVERSLAWATRFRRIVKDYERLPRHCRGPAHDRFRLSRVGKRGSPRRQAMATSSISPLDPGSRGDDGLGG